MSAPYSLFVSARFTFLTVAHPMLSKETLEQSLQKVSAAEWLSAKLNQRKADSRITIAKGPASWPRMQHQVMLAP